MVSITLSLAIALAAQSDPEIDARTVFALLERYHASFQDIAFIHEGTLVTTREKRGVPVPPYQFQGYYAYRNDGATLLDVFGRSRGDRPEARNVYAVLKGRLEIFNASPNFPSPVRNRSPDTARGGSGSLTRPDSPQRIFLAWYFASLGDPAEHDVELQGWEDVNGHRCLRLRMLKQPKPLLKGWQGGLPYVKLWIDVARDGYPIRYEFYRGDDLEFRAEISLLEQRDIPNGRSIWVPAEGRAWSYVGGGSRTGITHTKEPLSVGTYKILIPTVKFNQGLSDGFFSSKKHALVANDEGLTKLQRELDKTPPPKKQIPPADPESRRKRLDEALAEADRQAQQLEASSAARAGFGWSGAFYGSLGLAGVVMLSIAGFWYWRSR